MTATGQNIDMYKGDTKVFVVNTYDTANLPLDITNCVINYVAYRMTSGAIVLTKTTTSGIVITDPSGGEFEISLSPADTEGLLGYYLHECELTDPAGNVSTLFTGKLSIFDSKA